jgi:hypothetical protein
MTYKLFNALNGQKFVIRLIDNAMIPFDLSNIDYQDYLKWLDEGNTPQSADN